MSLQISEITMPSFARRVAEVPLALLPVGALEQHGPHLPLGFDYMHAQALAREVGRLAGCWVAPAVPYGMCRSTRLHPGTVGIAGDTLRFLLHDIAEGLFGQGIRGLCMLTGHAGGTHQSALVEVGEELVRTPGRAVAVVCVLDLLDEARDFLECPGDSHAGEVETSLAMHLWPELVQGSAPEEYPTFPRFHLVPDKLEYWPGGVWGDPGKASPDKGRRIFECEVLALTKVMNEMADRLKAGEGDQS